MKPYNKNLPIRITAVIFLQSGVRESVNTRLYYERLINVASDKISQMFSGRRQIPQEIHLQPPNIFSVLLYS